MSVNQICAVAQAGDDKAENELFNRLTARFRYIVRRKGIVKEDIEEIVQNALVVVSSNYRQMEFTTSFTAWAHKVLENKFIDFYRQKKIKGDKTSRLKEAMYVDAEAGSSLDLKRKLIECLKAVVKFNKTYARVLVLKYQGYAASEIYQRLELTRSNFYSVLSRARVMLDKCLKEKGAK